MQMSKESPVFSLVIPTYNESKNLPHLVRRVTRTLEEAGVSFEIIVVDDDSPDGTWKLAEEMHAGDPRVRLVRRRGERGLATAVVAGWKAARGEILGVMDSDPDYPPEAIADLFKAVVQGHADIAVASRYGRGSKGQQWGAFGKIISRGAMLLARLALPGALGELSDPTSACFLMQRSVAENVNLQPAGHHIFMEVLAYGRYNRVAEIPCCNQEEKKQASRLGNRQAAEFLFHLPRLSWQTGELTRLLKFCLVGFSGVFVNVGVLWVLTEVYRTYYIYSGAIAAGSGLANNFIWNERWTFADRIHGRRTVLDCLRRFFKFAVICSGGTLLYLGVLWSLTHLLGIYYLMSALFGIGVAAAWNYSLNANITWLSLKHAVQLMPASKPRTNEIRTGSPSPLPASSPARQAGFPLPLKGGEG